MSPGRVDISPVAVCVAPLGGGGAGPTMGTSPAKAETERTQLRLIAITKRFMDVLLMEIDDARVLTSSENRATSRSSCKALRETIVFGAICKLSYSHLEG
jgi:hypothetical protein